MTATTAAPVSPETVVESIVAVSIPATARPANRVQTFPVPEVSMCPVLIYFEGSGFEVVSARAVLKTSKGTLQLDGLAPGQTYHLRATVSSLDVAA